MVQLTRSIIQLPNPNTLAEIGQGFAELSGSLTFNRFVASLDGCQIRITCSPNVHDQYINRKLFYSLHLQDLVNQEGLFIDIFTGFPGSVHDSRVLRYSQLYRSGQYPPGGYFIIADGGYTCIERPITIVTPYRNPRQRELRAFNRGLKGFSVR